MDLILYGLPQAMAVEREILASDFRMTLGSSSAIFAHNLSTLGASVGFISLVGRDEMGRIALERLAESGVDLSRVVFTDKTATGITLLLPHGNVRRILTFPGTIAELTRAHLDFGYLASARHFHLSSLFLQRGLQPDLPQLLKDLKAEGLTISLDTNDDPDDRWNGVLEAVLPLIDILMPNEDELQRMARRSSVEEALTLLSQRVPLMVVKCGRRGAIIQQGDVRMEVPAIPVAALDTIGAGDSFNAGFISAYIRGLSPAECAHAGAVAGALSTLRPGGTEAFRDASLREDFLRESLMPFA